MTILNEPPSGDLLCDVCIIGTGPAGLALAIACERLGLTVVALEAGGLEPPPSPMPEQASAQISDGRTHAPLNAVSRRAFGGTSWVWSGACVTFDQIDFRARRHVPHSGWPLNHREIARYYRAAEAFLTCAPGNGEPAQDATGPQAATGRDSIMLFSEQPKLALAYREHVDRSAAITVCLNSPVVELGLSETGERIETVVVAARGRRWMLRPPRVVIAAGGLRTTQLLLMVQRQWPTHFGGHDGPLGRYYMGHLTGWIATITFTDRKAIEHFEPRSVAGRSLARRRLVIPDGLQLSEGLLNTVFWPSHVCYCDPAHASGPLSAFFLTAALPVLGAWLMPGTLRAVMLQRRPRQMAAHVRNVLTHPRATLGAATQALRNRLANGSAGGIFARGNGAGSYFLQYHAEHAPSPESRVTLGSSVDELGLPTLQVDLRYSEADARSVVEAHDVLARRLEGDKTARMEYMVPPEARVTSVLAQATDGFHQIGTTRMGEDQRTSVVDRNCQVHDVANLYVASSSVFPTSSQANPTLLVTALAIRLAQFLAVSVRASQRRKHSLASVS